MPLTDDALLFGGADGALEDAAAPAPPWTVLIVDDDREVHDATRLVLSDFTFGGRPLSFRHAFSAAEAADCLRAEPEIVVILLDCAMETDTAGLDLVRIVRHDLGNHLVRIVLRSGQPGTDVEHEIMAGHDINAYCDKTEMTDGRLKAVMVGALRSYSDVAHLDRERRDLERLLEGNSELLACRNLKSFGHTALDHLRALVHGGPDAAACVLPAAIRTPRPDQIRLLAGQGAFADLGGLLADGVGAMASIVHDAFSMKHSVFGHSYAAIYTHTAQDAELVFYIARAESAPPDAGPAVNTRLLEVFANRAGTAYDNLLLAERLAKAQGRTPNSPAGDLVDPEALRLISIIAHDVRGPLAGLIGIGDLMVRTADGLSKSALVDYARDIHAVAGQVYTLLDNLLDWTRLRMGRLELQIEAFDLADALIDPVEIYAGLARQRSIEIIADPDPDIEVRADLRGVQAVMRNLLSNAVKFTPDNGRIVVSAETDGDQVVLSVTDTGPGLSQTEADRMFRETPGRLSGGDFRDPAAGLGLRLCRDLIDRMGGTISARAVAGGGGAFVVTLPAAPR